MQTGNIRSCPSTSFISHIETKSRQTPARGARIPQDAPRPPRWQRRWSQQSCLRIGTSVSNTSKYRLIFFHRYLAMKIYNKVDTVFPNFLQGDFFNWPPHKNHKFKKKIEYADWPPPKSSKCQPVSNCFLRKR